MDAQILRIDLNKNSVEKSAIDKEVIKKFIGGRGLNSWTLFQEIEPGIDPLGPRNVICFSSGPMTATPLPLNSRIEVSTLSPITGILGDGNSGGRFPTSLRRAGYYQLVITGRAEKPVYICIENEQVQLLDASWLWGCTVWETVDRLKEINGSNVGIACIGPSGENLVRFASTMNDKYSSAAPGSGAVLGSKNVKAIVVKGTGKVDLADSDEFKRLAREDRKYFFQDKIQQEIVKKYGTHILNVWVPSDYRYFDSGFNAENLPEGLIPDHLKEHEIGRYSCHGCFIACKNRYNIPAGAKKGETGVGLEYETINHLGLNCGVTDSVEIMEIANMADAYGMDSICLGNAVAYAKYLFNRGIIGLSETGGLDLSWDNFEAQTELIHRIALREGFGSVVAEGMHGMARVIGGEAIHYCYHIKGFNRGVHPPGVLALANATATRGADHLRARCWRNGKRDPEIYDKLVQNGEVAEDMTLEPEKWMHVMERVPTITDTIGRCKGAVTSWICALPLAWKYSPMFEGVARLLTASTGIPFSAKDVESAADRIYVLERAFNIRQGITREDDRLVMKAGVESTLEGKDMLQTHDAMLDEYYRIHGYDLETGVPTSQRLEQLDIVEVDEDLKKRGPFQRWKGPVLWPQNDYPGGGNRC